MNFFDIFNEKFIEKIIRIDQILNQSNLKIDG